MRGGGPKKDDGQCLAVCKFEKLGTDNFKQYGMQTHEDSDDSDGYSADDFGSVESLECLGLAGYLAAGSGISPDAAEILSCIRLCLSFAALDARVVQRRRG